MFITTNLFSLAFSLQHVQTSSPDMSNKISLTDCNTGTTQKLPFGANITIELHQNIAHTSDSTGTPLTQNTPRWMPVLPTAVVTVTVLTPNGQFLYCATVAVCDRIMFRVSRDRPCVSLYCLLTFIAKAYFTAP
jgi:hypothetical protein